MIEGAYRKIQQKDDYLNVIGEKLESGASLTQFYNKIMADPNVSDTEKADIEALYSRYKNAYKGAVESIDLLASTSALDGAFKDTARKMQAKSASGYAQETSGDQQDITGTIVAQDADECNAQIAKLQEKFQPMGRKPADKILTESYDTIVNYHASFATNPKEVLDELVSDLQRDIAELKTKEQDDNTKITLEALEKQLRDAQTLSGQVQNADNLHKLDTADRGALFNLLQRRTQRYTALSTLAKDDEKARLEARGNHFAAVSAIVNSVDNTTEQAFNDAVQYFDLDAQELNFASVRDSMSQTSAMEAKEHIKVTLGIDIQAAGVFVDTDAARQVPLQERFDEISTQLASERNVYAFYQGVVKRVQFLESAHERNRYDASFDTVALRAFVEEDVTSIETKDQNLIKAASNGANISDEQLRDGFLSALKSQKQNIAFFDDLIKAVKGESSLLAEQVTDKDARRLIDLNKVLGYSIGQLSDTEKSLLVQDIVPIMGIDTVKDLTNDKTKTELQAIMGDKALLTAWNEAASKTKQASQSTNMRNSIKAKTYREASTDLQAVEGMLQNEQYKNSAVAKKLLKGIAAERKRLDQLATEQEIEHGKKQIETFQTQFGYQFTNKQKDGIAKKQRGELLRVSQHSDYYGVANALVTGIKGDRRSSNAQDKYVQRMTSILIEFGPVFQGVDAAQLEIAIGVLGPTLGIKNVDDLLKDGPLKENFKALIQDPRMVDALATLVLPYNNELRADLQNLDLVKDAERIQVILGNLRLATEVNAVIKDGIGDRTIKQSERTEISDKIYNLLQINGLAQDLLDNKFDSESLSALLFVDGKFDQKRYDALHTELRNNKEAVISSLNRGSDYDKYVQNDGFKRVYDKITTPELIQAAIISPVVLHATSTILKEADLNNDTIMKTFEIFKSVDQSVFNEQTTDRRKIVSHNVRNILMNSSSRFDKGNHEFLRGMLNDQIVQDNILIDGKYDEHFHRAFNGLNLKNKADREIAELALKHPELMSAASRLLSDKEVKDHKNVMQAFQVLHGANQENIEQNVQLDAKKIADAFTPVLLDSKRKLDKKAVEFFHLHNARHWQNAFQEDPNITNHLPDHGHRYKSAENRQYMRNIMNSRFPEIAAGFTRVKPHDGHASNSNNVAAFNEYFVAAENMLNTVNYSFNPKSFGEELRNSHSDSLLHGLNALVTDQNGKLDKKALKQVKSDMLHGYQLSGYECSGHTFHGPQSAAFCANHAANPAKALAALKAINGTNVTKMDLATKLKLHNEMFSAIDIDVYTTVVHDQDNYASIPNFGVLDDISIATVKVAEQQKFLRSSKATEESIREVISHNNYSDFAQAFKEKPELSKMILEEVSKTKGLSAKQKMDAFTAIYKEMEGVDYKKLTDTNKSAARKEVKGAIKKSTKGVFTTTLKPEKLKNTLEKSGTVTRLKKSTPAERKAPEKPKSYWAKKFGKKQQQQLARDAQAKAPASSLPGTAPTQRRQHATAVTTGRSQNNNGRTH